MRVFGGTALGAAVCLAFLAPAHGRPRPDEAILMDLVNSERAARGLPALRRDATLARLAREHAADMRRMGRATHESSADGATFSERLERTDLRASASAENVALAGDVRRAHRGLMDSPGHRANILNRDLTHVGIGIVPDQEGSIYVVEDFAALMPPLRDEDAAASVRGALRRARRGAALQEDRELSRRLAAALESLVAADSVKADADLLPGPGWIVCYTSIDPAALPDDVRRRAGKAAGYGLAVAFRRSPSYRFGAWWILLGLTEPS